MFRRDDCRRSARAQQRRREDLREPARAVGEIGVQGGAIGRAIAKNFEVNLGVETLLMSALAKPTWSDGTSIVAGGSGRGDGLATFGDQSTAGSVLVLVAPGVGARYDF